MYSIAEHRLVDTYLYIVKFLDPKIINYLKEFNTQRIWISIQNKNDKQRYLKYFPTYGKKVLPSIFLLSLIIFLDKGYLMNVLNTLDPGLILNTIKQLQKKKSEKIAKEANINIR